MTILIVGGAAQGKTAFAHRIAKQTDIIDDLHLLVRQALEHGQPLPQAQDFLGKTVVCNELGCGIVPMDASDRAWREETGRLCCAIAEQADGVYRMSCGIAQCIKSSEE